jgi:hypothetical protein
MRERRPNRHLAYICDLHTQRLPLILPQLDMPASQPDWQLPNGVSSPSRARGIFGLCPPKSAQIPHSTTRTAAVAAGGIAAGPSRCEAVKVHVGQWAAVDSATN